MHIPKSFGRALKPAGLPDGIARFFPVASAEGATADSSATYPQTSAEESGTGLPPDLLLPILRQVREDVAEIRQALSQVEVRMVAASLLIIYEANWERVREGLQYWQDHEREEEQSGDSNSNSDASSEGDKKPGSPCIVKLIDFAHTHLTPGEGVDEGVLFGVDTVLKLLDGRIEQVEAMVDTSS